MAMKEVLVPDLGSSDGVEVIEIPVQPGDTVAKEDTLLVLESDKATIEVPSPCDGEIRKMRVSVGDKVKEGDVIADLEIGEVSESENQTVSTEQKAPVQPASEKPEQSTSELMPKTTAPSKKPIEKTSSKPMEVVQGKDVHAGPAVRRLARELGVDLGAVSATGPRNRILKEDVHEYVKNRLTGSAGAAPAAMGMPALPEVDFSQWGEIETVELSKINKLSAVNLHRSWTTIPHVTQFDEADITDLEAFRKTEAPAQKAAGIKLTMLAFLVKACAQGLKAFPRFNASLHPGNEQLILKRYINIGIAVDTPNGLVVPVVKQADQKSLSEIASVLQELSEKARNKKLSPADMQGGCFSISSLGGIGGTAFTPIVNWPEVAILGVSRSQMKPMYNGDGFEPRLMLPLSLSYDHRVIDGAEAARFTVYLSRQLSDIRRLLL